MSRGTLIGLADLARLLQAEPDAFRDIFESDTVKQQAARLGYIVQPRQPQIPSSSQEHDAGLENKTRLNLSKQEGVGAERPPLSETAFWIATTFKARDPTPYRYEPQKAEEGLVSWRNPPKEPKWQSISSPQSLKPRLRNLLAPMVEGNDIDVRKMVRRVAYGKPLQNPPRRERRRWPASLLIIFDESHHLFPFFGDQRQVFALLKEVAHGMALRFAILSASNLRVSLSRVMERLKIGVDETVLLLGDLGSLSNAQAETAHLWVEFGYRLHACGARPVALTPGPPGLVNAHARNVWRVQAWDVTARRAKTDRQVRENAVEHLLTLAAPATRIQTGLLRDLRLKFKADFDAGIEAQVWNNKALENAGAVCAHFDPKEANEYRRKFDLLDRSECRQAWKIVRRWRYGLPQSIAFQEIRSLPRDVVDLQDFEDAKRYFGNLAALFRDPAEQISRSYSMRAWINRLQTNDIQPLLQCPEILDLIVTNEVRNSSSVLSGSIDPKDMPPQPRASGPIRLAHVGEVFKASSADQEIADDSAICLLPSGNGRLRIKQLEDDPFWIRNIAPTWAANWGADEFGLWVSFRLDADNGATVEQRLRWMPAGTFMMGSPEDETGRYDRESPQHEVTFEQGFWMFETAVTQELWSAVMGNNPSRFKGSRLPVENVSWNDAKEFIERLNSRLPGLELRLPSEAEWEYSCRAGTEAAYSFGETITTEQVNFERNVGQTVEVASLPPNGWGLYEMHGNVYEWCEDTWHDSYEGAPTDGSAWIDAEDASAASRVVRGGSWLVDARDVRSAYRLRYEPSYRSSYLGFRCARGPVRAQPASAEKPGRAASARRERSDAMQTMSAPAIGLELGRNPTREPPKAERLLVQSDRAAITLERMSRQDWASGMGRDQYGLYAEFEIETVTQRLRWIPPGTFMMGSPDNEPGRFDAEGPQHQVQISEGYWLFSTPVTQALYEAVVGEKPSRFESPDRPVEQVSFEDAGAFLKQINDRLPGLGLRLPSEAEWEYACRAGTTAATYAGPMEILGDNNAPILDDIAWYGGNSGVDFDLEDGHDSSDWEEKKYDHMQAGTRRVGLKRPNSLGLYDMLGNVWEWCEDIFQDSYEGAPADGFAWLDAEDASAALRVVRGGSWFNVAQAVRSAYRLRYKPSEKYDDLGFRCARGWDK